jgi:hypothetical protein
VAEHLTATRALVKEGLPLIKLATFGSLRTRKGSLRNDENVLAVYGVEVDYDGEVVPFAEACNRLRGTLAIVYTSPSHRPDAPRWRALLPFAAAREPVERAGWALRAGAILGIELGPDSLTLSQTYYAGKINDDFQMEVIPGDPIDVGHKPVPVAVRRRGLLVERQPFQGWTDYGKAALRDAARNIMHAPDGQQDHTLNREGFTVGQNVGAGILPYWTAVRVLILAARQIPDYDPRRPWNKYGLKKRWQAPCKVKSAFLQGLQKPADPNYGEPADGYDA